MARPSQPTATVSLEGLAMQDQIRRVVADLYGIRLPAVGEILDLPPCETIETTFTVTTTATSAQFPHRLGRPPIGAIYLGQYAATVLDDLVVQPDLQRSDATTFWFRRWRANPASGSASTTARFLVF